MEAWKGIVVSAIDNKYVLDDKYIFFMRESEEESEEKKYYFVSLTLAIEDMKRKNSYAAQWWQTKLGSKEFKWIAFPMSFCKIEF